MGDLDPRFISYGIFAVVLVVGVFAVRRMIRGFQEKTASAPRQAVAEALKDGNYLKAGRTALDQGDWQSAAKHFLKADRPLDAARAYRKGEQWSRAAEMFEELHDYVSAAQCFQKVGNDNARLRVLAAAEDWASCAELAEKTGNLTGAAEFALKLGWHDHAIAALTRAGELTRATEVNAEKHEKLGDWKEAASLWMKAESWERALAAATQCKDEATAAKALVQLGNLELAADKFSSVNAFAEAAQLYEQLGQYRKAAMQYQRAGNTEKALGCLMLQGDKAAVFKMRVALGQTDEALRVGRGLSATDGSYVEVCNLTADLHASRDDLTAAVATMLQLLEAPLERNALIQSATKTLQWLVTLKDGVRARQVWQKIAPLLGTSDDQQENTDQKAWAEAMRKQITELPMPAVAAAQATTGRRLATSQITTGESTDNYDGAADLLDEATKDQLGGRARTPDGWPAGVPVALADRYEELERLGQGGNGVVFRASDKLLGRQVVLKFMIEGTMPSEIARKYFLREVKLSASLNHPNIVHIYDMGNTDGVLWYAMEFVEGATLTSFLQKVQPIRDNVFLISVVEQLCAALDHAHGMGMVHRDIKPDNVLVASDGAIKLLDFGLARVMDEGFGEQSVLAGTPYYMAPEQLDGSAVDHRADIYALGVILFRLFTGRLPFVDGNVFVSHAVEAVPDPRKYNPEMPTVAVDIIMKCMAKRPGDRYGNCRQIALDVRHALFGTVADNK